MSLCFPQKILDQHAVVLGKTGAGKSSALRHVVEHLLRKEKRVCVIDPKGDWWGLKWAADGKGQGYPVIAFGDFKESKAADIPLNAQSGKHVAELVATGNRPAIIGMRGWMTSAMVRFWIDFASTLFAQNAGEIYLVGDEFHNFAPKGKIMDPEAGKCLHWSNRILSEGRGLGIVCLIASQRPQKVHNDTLTSCETLIAMRVIHAADRGAVQDWIKGCGDKETGDQVLNSLAQMPRGEAYVWSPEIGFGPELVKFPMFETFDSFAPPQLQKGWRPATAATWENVDLEEVKAKLAAVIEEQKSNDPKELKKILADVRHNYRLLQQKCESVQQKALEVKRIEEPVLDEKARRTLVRAMEVCDGQIVELQRREKLLQKISGELHELNVAVTAKLAQATARSDLGLPSKYAARPPIQTSPPARSTTLRHPNGISGSGPLAKAERAVLRVLASYPDGKSKRETAVIAGYAHNGGGFNNAVSALRSAGYVDGSDPLRITAAGAAAIGPVDPLPTGEELFKYWSNHSDLGQAEREVLRVLYEAGGQALTKEQIAAQTVSAKGGPYEANGGGFNNAISRLRTYELISGRNELAAAKEFFEDLVASSQ